jgi:hypothetical protein
METEIKLEENETYISPDITIVDIQTEQNILASASTLDLPGEDW